LEKEVKEDLMETSVKLEIDQKATRVETLLTRGKLEKAEKLMAEVAASDSEHKDLKFLKGLSLYMQGKLKEAVAILDEILKEDKNLEKAKKLREKSMKINELMESANEKIKEKKHQESIDILTEIVGIDKNNVNINQAAYFQRSMAHYSLGNSSSAFADFKMFEGLQRENGKLKIEDETSENPFTN
jgi:tetratricopeptide (TPR) repeat protein